MSLKFGIYLVEQRIVSPEQFCGLVKIQQEAATSLATVAIRKNLLTIKQVANILDIHEVSPEKSFTTIAIECDYFDRADAEQLLHEQNMTRPSIRQLVVECGLLTARQTQVLFAHFEKTGTRKTVQEPTRTEAPTRSQPQLTPAEAHAEQTTATPVTTSAPKRPAVRQPKFKQRPIVVQPYSNTME